MPDEAILAARDEAEWLRAALVAADAEINRLQRLIGYSTVVDLRYAFRSGIKRLTVEVWCRDCPDMPTVEACAWNASYGLVRDAIRRHELECHADEPAANCTPAWAQLPSLAVYPAAGSEAGGV